MTRRVLPLVLALALSVLAARSFSAPTVNTWEANAVQVWPPASRGVAADTMTRQLSAGDSIDTTDPVPVFGARGVLLVVKSSGSDSMSVPVLQEQVLGGDWTGTGGGSFLPPTAGNIVSALNATSAITTITRFAWGYDNEVSTGGTPVPISNTNFRWRVKSTDARRYATANSATLAPTGNYTIWAIVLK